MKFIDFKGIRSINPINTMILRQNYFESIIIKEYAEQRTQTEIVLPIRRLFPNLFKGGNDHIQSTTI